MTSRLIVWAMLAAGALVLPGSIAPTAAEVVDPSSIGADSSWIAPALAEPIETLSITNQTEALIRQTALECEETCRDVTGSGASQATRQFHVLPDGLLWRSYLAGPHEPRISTVVFSDLEGRALWDATLGGRVGLLRYGTAESTGASGWQWDLEGAVMTRLDMLNSQDVDSMDYRVGTQWTAAEDDWSMKVGYFHISSHIGDEYLIRNPAFQRINYVTESFVLGLSRDARPDLRIYGESAFAWHRSGGSEPWQFQTGAEYVPQAKSDFRGSPFVAANVNLLQAVDFHPTLITQAGWRWRGSRSGRTYRVGAHYHDGYSSQFQFFRWKERQIGMGMWFDY